MTKPFKTIDEQTGRSVTAIPSTRAADMLGVDRQAVTRAIQRGDLAGGKIPGTRNYWIDYNQVCTVVAAGGWSTLGIRPGPKVTDTA